MVASLPKIPAEILLAILDHYGDAQDRQQIILTLSVTCKELRELCLPILFEKIYCTSQPEVATRKLELIKTHGNLVKSLEFTFKHHWRPHKWLSPGNIVKRAVVSNMNKVVSKFISSPSKPAKGHAKLTKLHEQTLKDRNARRSFDTDALSFAARTILRGDYTPNLSTCVLKFDWESNGVRTRGFEDEQGVYEPWADENVAHESFGHVFRPMYESFMLLEDQYGDRAFTYAAEQEVVKLWRARMAHIWRALASNSTVRELRVHNLPPKITSVFATVEWRTFLARLRKLEVWLPEHSRRFIHSLLINQSIIFAEIRTLTHQSPSPEGWYEDYVFLERLPELFTHSATNLDSLAISVGHNIPIDPGSPGPTFGAHANLTFKTEALRVRSLSLYGVCLEADTVSYLRQAESLQNLELHGCFCRGPDTYRVQAGWREPITWADMFDGLVNGAPQLRGLVIVDYIEAPPSRVRQSGLHTRRSWAINQPDDGGSKIQSLDEVLHSRDFHGDRMHTYTTPWPLIYRSVVFADGDQHLGIHWGPVVIQRRRFELDMAAYRRIDERIRGDSMVTL